MSAFVRSARTRIWRTIVAIIRGGNFGGAAWQRAQLERKRFSPSKCRLSSCVVFAEAEAVAVAEAGESLLPAFLALAPSVSVSARKAAAITNFIFITCFLSAPAA